MVIIKPWGRENIIERNSFYTVKIIEIWPNKRLSKQYHKKKIETVYVLFGPLVMNGKHYGGGSYLTIKPGHIHRFECESPGCILIEVSHIRFEDS